jgi:hypothetical protein
MVRGTVSESNRQTFRKNRKRKRKFSQTAQFTHIQVTMKTRSIAKGVNESMNFRKTIRKNEKFSNH